MPRPPDLARNRPWPARCKGVARATFESLDELFLATHSPCVLTDGDRADPRRRGQGRRSSTPTSSAPGSRVCPSSFALRELRTQARGDPLRTLYAFDPARQAVLLIGGDKIGDDRFYDRMIPIAEKIWNDYLEETRQKSPRNKP